MKWFMRPKFFDNGSWTLERVELVPVESIQHGWTMSAEEFVQFWKPIV